MMPISLCIPPRTGELCAPIRFPLHADSTVLELTSRHRVTEIDWDAAEHAIVVVVEITDPATSRPVNVRFDVLTAGAEALPPRSRLLGRLCPEGRPVDVYGTYLGVVADEN